MDKIKVTVCLGTSCFAKGRENLQSLNEIIPQKYGDRVEVESSLCLGFCSIKLKEAKAPYVTVDDTIIEEATVEKILASIDEKLIVKVK